MKQVHILLSSIILVTIVFASPCFAGWLVYHKPEFRGKVIDAETKSPLEGAVVVAIYRNTYIISGPAGGSSSIINIKEALTDQKGEFYIPSYKTLIQPLSKEDVVDFIIYKPGYASHPGWAIYPFNYIGPEYMFSKKFGEKEKVTSGKKVISIIMGIVELPRLKSREDRLKAVPGRPTDYRSEDLPLLYKAINKERKSFGLGEIK
jgi:hypothetical protein